MTTVPYIPDNAPFTAEQRAYLNGFFAGLFSVTTENAPKVPTTNRTVTILFGSQTGNSEGLARRIAKEARGFAASVCEMAKYPIERLASERAVVIITSTYGDGEPPDNAKAFWEGLSGSAAPKLPELRFAVCALGDSNYPQFCAFGKALDAQLEKLGAARALPRIDCDVDYEGPFKSWLEKLWPALSSPQPAVAPSSTDTPAPKPAPSSAYNRNNPLLAPLITNRKLNGDGSAKETRHFEFSLASSDLTYQAGDTLGVIPTNCPELVGAVLRALRFKGDESIATPEGDVPIREGLARQYEITRISDHLLKAVAERSKDAELLKLIEPGVNGELTQFLYGRDVLDLLLRFPDVRFSPAEFVELLRKLQPRLYSISSSPKTCPGEVHLTVAIVRYVNLDRPRKGLCSAFLADRIAPGNAVPVFVQKNKHFRPPQDASRPMIMVGPGTGIAPFRAFLHERQSSGATGRNWLFFGDQHQATDFLYRDEMETMLRDKTLSRLDVAFSRDQAEKLYVQHRMLENAAELYAWLEDGAHFYVCGDAKRMAKDVDAALQRVIEIGGSVTPDRAREYVQALSAQKRYQRDVY
jgi:sulfite reductase (NADPH) flavoprotein alpha-component